jgi:hypothetical protein
MVVQMPITADILKNAVVLTLAGEYTAADLDAAVAAVLSHPAFKPGSGLIYDVRQAGLTRP